MIVVFHVFKHGVHRSSVVVLLHTTNYSLLAISIQELLLFFRSSFLSERIACLIEPHQTAMDGETVDGIEKKRIEEAERAALLLSDRAIVAQRDLFRLTNEHNGLFSMSISRFCKCFAHPPTMIPLTNRRRV